MPLKIYRRPEWVLKFMEHSSPHLGALACFMFLTGARISEAVGVKWGKVDLPAGRVIISMGKLGGEERVGRNAIGIELNPAYVAVAQQRLGLFGIAA